MDSNIAPEATDNARKLDDYSQRVRPPSLRTPNEHQVNVDEHAPLLRGQGSNGNLSHRPFQDTQHPIDHRKRADLEVASKSSFQMFLMCLGIGGLQMAWAAELSNGSPYLLSLGMSKSWLAIVWIAGPLSGVLVQPIVGRLSDNCRVSWGRRRPYMLAGAAATVLSLLALAWTTEIVSGILDLFDTQLTEDNISKAAIGFAIFWVYVLDFSINTLQASIRAFIVDNAPAHQQDKASAWASRILGFGNILGYLSGYINLPLLFPFLGDTQFKVLCAISCIGLTVAVSISCFCVPESDPRLRWPSSEAPNRGIAKFLKGCLTSITKLTPQTQKVCLAQFFNWMAWFPFLFYITTYIGQLHLNPLFQRNPHMSHDEINKAWEQATRFGSFALLVFAVVSFAANSLFPLFIEPLHKPQRTACHNIEDNTRAGCFDNLYIPNLTIRRAWFLSHLVFSACMFSTFLIATSTAATVMTGMAGLSWAMTLWAPFALISRDISKRNELKAVHRMASSLSKSPGVPGSSDGGASAEENVELAVAPKTEEPVEDQAGAVLGLHNVAICAPQVIATVVSSIIFGLVQRKRGAAGDDSIGWVLRFGGLAALAAAWRTLKIEEEWVEESAETRCLPSANESAI